MAGPFALRRVDISERRRKVRTRLPWKPGKPPCLFPAITDIVNQENKIVRAGLLPSARASGVRSLLGRWDVMAGKSRRVASRQGELSRRRKRNQRGPSGVPAAPARPDQDSGNGVAVATANATTADAAVENGNAQQGQAVAVAAPAAAASPAPAPQPRAQGRTRGERPAAYNYVGAELRRIGVLATVVVAALVALSVVL